MCQALFQALQKEQKTKQMELCSYRVTVLRFTAGVSFSLWHKKWFSARDDVAPSGYLATSGDTVHCHNCVEGLLTSGGQRTGMLLNTLQGTQCPFNKGLSCPK